MRAIACGVRTMALVATVAVAVAAGGCVNLNVRKVYDRVPDPEAKPGRTAKAARGERVALPKPFLYAEPQGDGSVKVVDVYYPDPHNEYAVDASAFAADFELAIERTNGVLSKVTFAPDPTGFPTAGMQAGAAVGSKILEQQAAEEEAARTRREERKKARDAAQARVDQLRGELALLEAERDATQDADARAAVEVKIAVKQREIELAEQALAGLRRGGSDAASAGDDDDDAGGSEKSAGKSFTPRWGPVLYAINETVGEDGRPVITLEPVRYEDGDAQRQFETVDHSPEKKPEAPKGPAQPAAPKLGVSRDRDPHSALGPVVRVKYEGGMLADVDVNSLAFYTDPDLKARATGPTEGTLRQQARVEAGDIVIPAESLKASKITGIGLRGERQRVP